MTRARMTRAISALLKQSDRPTIARVGGSSTTQMATPSCGAHAFLSGFTDIPPGASLILVP